MKNSTLIRKRIDLLSSFVISLVLGILGFLIYSNTFKSSFQCDDFFTIVSNHSIRHLDLLTLWQAFNTRFVVGVTLAFNYALGKENVVGYHLFNTLVHVLNSYLVYILVCLTFKTPRMSKSVSVNPRLLGFLTALLFLSHPLQTQAVTYIWQRATSLASFFYLGALVFYIRTRLKFSTLSYALCLLCTVLGMFTKEIVFTLPLAMGLYELIFLRQLPLKTIQRVLLWVPLLLTLLIIPWTMTKANEQTLDIIRPKSARIHHESSINNFRQMTRTADPQKIPRHEFVLTELNVLRTYLRLFLLPVNQNVDYDYPRARSLLEPNTLISFLLLISLFASALILLKKHPLPAFGILWFFLTVSVESLVAQEEFIFEHRLYLPMVGLILFLMIAGSTLFKNNPRRFTLVLLGIVTCYSLLTYQRNFVWKDAFTLWDDVVNKSPKKARAYNGRGTTYQNKGLLDNALLDYNKAIQLEPGYADAYSNRAATYEEKGLLDLALTDCNIALRIDPTLAEAYNCRASIYRKKGLLDQALSDFDKAIKLKPDYAQAYSNRGAVYEAKGLFDKALVNCNRAIELKPHLVEAYNNRGVIYEKMGLFDQALADYNKAIALKPKFISAYSNRGSVYLKKGLLDQALSDCNKIIEMNPNTARSYNNRAVVYNLKKEYDKSRQDFMKAQSLGFTIDPGLLKELEKPLAKTKK